MGHSHHMHSLFREPFKCTRKATSQDKLRLPNLSWCFKRLQYGSRWEWSYLHACGLGSMSPSISMRHLQVYSHKPIQYEQLFSWISKHVLPYRFCHFCPFLAHFYLSDLAKVGGQRTLLEFRPARAEGRCPVRQPRHYLAQPQLHPPAMRCTSKLLEAASRKLNAQRWLAWSVETMEPRCVSSLLDPTAATQALDLPTHRKDVASQLLRSWNPWYVTVCELAA